MVILAKIITYMYGWHINNVYFTMENGIPTSLNISNLAEFVGVYIKGEKICKFINNQLENKEKYYHAICDLYVTKYVDLQNISFNV